MPRASALKRVAAHSRSRTISTVHRSPSTSTARVIGQYLRRKTTATDPCIDIVRLALDLGGDQADDRPGGIERLFRDVQGCLYHPLPAAQQELFTGRLSI